MVRPIQFASVALALLTPAWACSCTVPPPLSDCAVRENQTALLVTIKCVMTRSCNINDGMAVADVEIDQVFRDNTDLMLKKGDNISIGSCLSSAACGTGGSFERRGQWIMFADTPRPPFVSQGDYDFLSEICNIDASEADLETNSCERNVFEPTTRNVSDLALGCSPFISTQP